MATHCPAKSRPRPCRAAISALSRFAIVASLAVGATNARACGFHDAAAVNLGMLNQAYPDALHVRTAVWMAQRDARVPVEARKAIRDLRKVLKRIAN